MEETPASASPQPQKSRVLWIILLTVCVCLGICCLPVIYIYKTGFLEYALSGGLVPPKNLNPIMANANKLMNDGKYDQAIPLWNEVIQQAPSLDYAYYQRATCYYDLLPKEHDETTYSEYNRLALDDMDKAISLSPHNGDYYAFRHDVLISMADQEVYFVNRQALTRIAHDNILAAIALGPSKDFLYNDRVAAADLIDLDQCDQGLAQTQAIQDRTSLQDSSITGLYRFEGEAYACLGQLDKAVQAMDASTQNSNYLDEKIYLKAAYLYQSGKLDEALSVLNETLTTKPTFMGYRYYLRALIYYEKDEIALATSDLETGSKYTWGRSALYAYVNGRMALDKGDRAEGIRLLQEAEATVDHNFNTLRTRIQLELANLGAKPMVITPSVTISSTPIPINMP